MPSNDLRQAAFRRILAREAGTGVTAPAIAAAARRTCEHLAAQLTPVIGGAGVAAICARSLHLTQQTFPGLAVIHAAAQGQPPFVLLELALEQQPPAEAVEAAITLLCTVSDLLALFIGEELTARFLREAWPTDFAGGDVAPRR